MLKDGSRATSSARQHPFRIKSVSSETTEATDTDSGSTPLQLLSDWSDWWSCLCLWCVCVNQSDQSPSSVPTILSVSIQTVPEKMTVTVLDPCVWNPLWSGRVCVGSVSLQHFSSPVCLLELSDPSSATDETNEPVIIFIILFNNWLNKFQLLLRLLNFRVTKYSMYYWNYFYLNYLYFDIFDNKREACWCFCARLWCQSSHYLCYINCDYLIDWRWFWCGFVWGSSPCSEDYSSGNYNLNSLCRTFRGWRSSTAGHTGQRSAPHTTPHQKNPTNSLTSLDVTLMLPTSCWPPGDHSENLSVSGPAGWRPGTGRGFPRVMDPGSLSRTGSPWDLTRASFPPPATDAW